MNIPSCSHEGIFFSVDFRNWGERMYLQDYLDGYAINAYRYFGAHPDARGCMFRVYAPGAKDVSLICSVADWEPLPMQRDPAGVYQLYLPKAKAGDLYKFRVHQKNGRETDKCDPYGVQMELRPNTASIVTDLSDFTFTDAAWMEKRSVGYDKPMHIYELHAGSWRHKSVTDKDAPEEAVWYDYAQLAELLIPYLREHGYTHVELLPLSEHPFDGSWGYQASGFFAPTSRYGTPQQLMAFINQCHENDIGVLLDFVSVHFVGDDFALSEFDGTPLYEYQNDSIGYSEWGSKNFDYYKGHVRSFLCSSANYWLEQYHFDGLRMDAISNALYWQGDRNRGVNIGGVRFLKDMNAALKQRHPDVMLIAEDSTNYLKVTAPVQYDGLGFDYKWDMGWMNDTLSFFKLPPSARPAQYHQLSFSMLYFYSELYLLPFSHDEVVHGKATILQKMWGDYDVKFPQCRTLFVYMLTHPGKKLNFMGNEIGHFREWDEAQEMDWLLLKYPMHDGFRCFCRALNQLYLSHPALYDGDYNPHQFCWLEVDAPQECVFAYRRTAPDGTGLVIVLNLSDRAYKPFFLGVDAPMALRELLCSDACCWDGSGLTNGDAPLVTEKQAHKGHSYRIGVQLAPFGSTIFEILPKKQTKK